MTVDIDPRNWKWENDENGNPVPVIKKENLSSCVAAAKDALQRLKSGQYKTWECVTVDFNKIVKGSLKEYIESGGEVYVCPLGALICSAALMEDIELSPCFEISLLDEKIGIIEKHFSFEELKMIEMAYEGINFNVYDKGRELTKEEIKAIKKFRKNYPEADERFAAILENIIENNAFLI